MKNILKILTIIFVLTIFTTVAFADSAETPTVTETILAWCEENITHIFTGSSLSLSLILAFLFKKGLLPSLTNGLSKITDLLASGVSKLTVATEKMAQSTDERLQAFADRISPVIEGAEKVSEVAKQTEQSLKIMQEELDRCKKDREVLTVCLNKQTDFLYSVFMSANLPAYQKEQMGESYNDMKKVIASLSPVEGE